MKILVLLALISASRSFSFFPSSRRHGQPVFPSSTSSVPTSRSLRPCGASALFAEEGGGGGGEMDRERQGKSKVSLGSGCDCDGNEDNSLHFVM